MNATTFEFVLPIIPVLIISFILLIIAFFIFRYHASNRPIIATAAVMLLVSIALLFEGILNHPLSPEFFNDIMRVYLIFTILLQTSLFIASWAYREHETNTVLGAQRKLLVFFVIPYVVIWSMLVLWTDIYFNGDLRVIQQVDDHAIYGIPQAYNAVTWIIYQSVLYVLATYNVYCIYALPEKDLFKKRSRLLILISVVLTGIGGVLSSTLNFLESTGIFIPENRAIWTNGYRFILLVAALSFFLGFTKYSAMIKLGRALVKDFFIYALSSVTVVLLYLVPLCFIFALGDSFNKIPLLIVFALTMPIITHSGHEKYNHILQNLFESKVSSSHYITIDNIQFALKNVYSERSLAQSELLYLTTVDLESKRQNITKEAALKYVVLDVLEMMKPQSSTYQKRSKATLKYEILRMIIQEQAVESQILWDLGFKSKSMITQGESPRYPILSNSDYTSTSIISYKRLRKEAISEFKWQLQSYEEKALRLK